MWSVDRWGFVPCWNVHNLCVITGLFNALSKSVIPLPRCLWGWCRPAAWPTGGTPRESDPYPSSQSGWTLQPEPNPTKCQPQSSERRRAEMGLGTDSDGSAGRYFCPCRLGRTLGKGGQCANKFYESQIRKLADLPNLLGLWTFCKCGKVLFSRSTTENILIWRFEST